MVIAIVAMVATLAVFHQNASAIVAPFFREIREKCVLELTTGKVVATLITLRFFIEILRVEVFRNTNSHPHNAMRRALGEPAFS